MDRSKKTTSRLSTWIWDNSFAASFCLWNGVSSAGLVGADGGVAARLHIATAFVCLTFSCLREAYDETS
jgi:hypothetical protein